MPLDFATLESLRQNHPAWRLLCSPHAPLIAAFLQRVFVTPNVRVMAQANLVEALDDELFAVREAGAEFPRSAQEYLNDWAEHGYLRKFYAQGSDEPQFDLSVASEKALGWLENLAERQFVGTESRLLTLFDLLKQMDQGSELDPKRRLAQLQQQRAEIDAEIARVEQGDLPVMDSTGLKDRFQQFTQLARELLGDFREVESNFRGLDRRVREQIATWNDSRGSLLHTIMGERDAIFDTDQGKSFHAFWDFLMSSERQQQLTSMLSRVLKLAPIAQLQPDVRIKRVHYDWLEAGEHTQRTVAQLSQQLRRFLDDQAWLENRRIMDILHQIEARALALRDVAPGGDFISIATPVAEIDLPMERPLYRPAAKPQIVSSLLAAGQVDENDSDAMAALYAHNVVDKAKLAYQIRKSLHLAPEISLGQLCQQQPLEHGLAELVVYVDLAENGAFHSRVELEQEETIRWQGVDSDGASVTRQARLPRIVYCQSHSPQEEKTDV
ncbi:MAG: hypothetical protein RL748_1368 [Pseudomonadota bacterium]|jgi:hypothetical protein